MSTKRNLYDFFANEQIRQRWLDFQVGALLSRHSSPYPGGCCGGKPKMFKIGDFY